MGDGGFPSSGPAFVVVGGYGLPGRSLVEMLRQRRIDYQVIELNREMCHRVAAGGVNIMAGDAADLETLRDAGAARANLVVLMMPDDQAVLRGVSNARLLNPRVHIIARCAYTSCGLEAMRRGADQTIVAEQIIATELGQLASPFLSI
ncbi:MAG: NAD(P)-binding protein [Tepidisphaeraceae bacterium]|jgi:voltage-gated potassium channel Kch